jgi:PD-(D/E)XK nuclease superfamily
LGELKLCARRYQLSILQGHTPHHINNHLTFGIHYAKSNQTFHKARAKGQDHVRALQTTVVQTLLDTWDSALGRPWPSEDPNKNRGTLIRSIIWYYEHFENDPLEVILMDDGEPATEVRFRVSLGFNACTGETYSLTGHLDKVVRGAGKTWIVDQKTTKSSLDPAYFARYTPDNQVSAYAVAGRMIFDEDVEGVIIDAAQVLVGGTRFQRGFIPRNESQLDEWMKDTGYWIRQAERYAVDNYWPMNDKACGNVHLDPKSGEVSYGCPFREVCSSNSPETRELLLKAHFKKRVWNPLATR